MSADRLNKGMRATALLLAVATLGACGTATVVKPAGGRGGSTVHTTPQASVAKPGQTAVIRKGDTLYALARIHNITPRDLAAWMKMRRFSRAAFCPTNSSRFFGRSAASTSSGRFSALRMRSVSVTRSR